METTDRQYFEILKKKIVETMQSNHAGLSKSMEDWKGSDILKFKEDLEKMVNAYISEKSFYNHFKTYHDKLPRIDLLNILSRYTGYVDWDDFKEKNEDNLILVTEYQGSNRIFYILGGLAFVVFLITWILIKTGSVRTYTFCFVDKDTREPITDTRIEVILLMDNQSPLHHQCDSSGCFTHKTGEQRAMFLAKAPFYVPDTIKRILKKGEKHEIIPLQADDYALMLHYFTHSKVDDWRKRREQLDGIIADSAYLCQVFNPSMTGIELYNKKEFIDLLTMPTSSLKQIEILEILHTHEKITTIRFRLDYISP